MTISNKLDNVKHTELWGYFVNKINKAFALVKENFEEFISKELLNAVHERRELLLIVKSELQSIVWELRMIKMQEGKYQIFSEFQKQFSLTNYFGAEKELIRCFTKTNRVELIKKIIEAFKIIFENTNSSKYANVDKRFEMFARNLSEEIPNYSYIAWEKLLVELREEKPLDFPSVNEILRRVEKTEIPIKKVEFLKELKLID